MTDTTVLIDTTVRCFRKKDPGLLRRGIWLMTGPYRGAYFHGGRDEVQAPEWTLEELADRKILFTVEEISPAEALAELANWPAAAIEAQAIFARHPQSPAPPAVTHHGTPGITPQ